MERDHALYDKLYAYRFWGVCISYKIIPIACSYKEAYEGFSIHICGINANSPIM